MRIAYVNGAYTQHAQAAVHIDDRGYQFADGVYEVACLINGQLIDFDEHLDRLDRSLDELQIPNPVDRPTLKHICGEVIRLNRLQSGLIYIQMTRGVAPRFHAFPKHAEPSIVITAKYINHREVMAKVDKGIAAITLPDTRWARPDIKSISLLPNVLGKQKAVEAGAYEAILYNTEGFVTETNSTNVWIVDQSGVLKTPPTSRPILPGVTRQRLIDLLKDKGIVVQEVDISLDDLRQAREIIFTASVSSVMPVVLLDQVPVGTGKPGEMVQFIKNMYLDYTGG